MNDDRPSEPAAVGAGTATAARATALAAAAAEDDDRELDEDLKLPLASAAAVPAAAPAAATAPDQPSVGAAAAEPLDHRTRRQLIEAARSLLMRANRRNPPGFYSMRKADLKVLVQELERERAAAVPAAGAVRAATSAAPAARRSGASAAPAAGEPVDVCARSLAELNVLTMCVLEKVAVPALQAVGAVPAAADQKSIDITGASERLAGVKDELASAYGELLGTTPEYVKYFTPQNRAIFGLLMLNTGTVLAAAEANRKKATLERGQSGAVSAQTTG